MSEGRSVSSDVGSEDARPVWQQGLIARLGDLGPDVGSRVLLDPPASGDLVSAERFLDPDYLRLASFAGGASRFGSLDGVRSDGTPEVNPAVAASRFTRHYVSSLTAAALVGLAHGVGLDLSVGRCVKVVDHGLPRQHLVRPDDGVITCQERPAPWPTGASMAMVSTVEELRQQVWRQLYAEHLAPLFAVASALTGATPHLLWSNAAEWVAHTADMATDHMSAADCRPIIEEVEAVLDAEQLPGVEGANPLAGLVEWLPVDDSDFPQGVSTRRHCCITYLLPVRLGRLCGNCPFLPLPDRLALCRESRVDNIRGGPAELRSIEIGLAKIRTKSDRRRT